MNIIKSGIPVTLKLKWWIKNDRKEKAGVITFKTIVKNQRDEDVVILTQKSLFKKKLKDL